ncbi:MAG TPA: SIS domain-containing protein [Acidimicrobiales bacterium]|nr:SIS domain-containing protein [Acidimicrobiales bacterium]
MTSFMVDEMADQPRVLADLVARAGEIRDQVASLAGGPFHGVTLVARGSSACAALYGRYLLEAATGHPVSVAAPSLHTLYRVDADYSGQLVIALSQSGETREIVEVTTRLASCGAATFAVTNDHESALAGAARQALALGAGAERAIPATKTVTAEVVALALIAAALGPVPFDERDLRRLPLVASRVLADDSAAAALAGRLSGANELLVAARGYLLPAALELALKVKETAQLFAVGYSAAELRHGHIASIRPGTPAVLLACAGPAHSYVRSLADELARRDVPVYLADEEPGSPLPLPSGLPEALAPVPAILRAQQLAYHLALARGHDPDTPAGLEKITNI